MYTCFNKPMAMHQTPKGAACIPRRDSKAPLKHKMLGNTWASRWFLVSLLSKQPHSHKNQPKNPSLLLLHAYQEPQCCFPVASHIARTDGTSKTFKAWNHESTKLGLVIGKRDPPGPQDTHPGPPWRVTHHIGRIATFLHKEQQGHSLCPTSIFLACTNHCIEASGKHPDQFVGGQLAKGLQWATKGTSQKGRSHIGNLINRLDWNFFPTTCQGVFDPTALNWSANGQLISLTGIRCVVISKRSCKAFSQNPRLAQALMALL